MERFTKEELKYLKDFEHHFACALDSGFLRGVSYTDGENMLAIYQRVTGKTYRLNHDCGTCMFEFIKLIGSAYRKECTLIMQEQMCKQKNKGKKTSKGK